MWHATDPRTPRRAVTPLARLVAQGRLDAAAAEAVLAAAPAPGADASGWAARRAWALADGAAHWRRQRRWAARAMREALAPLLAAHAPRAALEAAAAQADPDTLFTDEERMALVRNAVAAALAGGPARG